MKINHKLIASGVALAMAAVLAVSGTFAWQSLGQTAKNEARGSVNPGGRLHDDFDGRSRNVYVENFTVNGTPIYARVRLDEYMETGTKAGQPDGDGKTAQTAVKKGELGNKKTWRTRTPNTQDTITEAWEWETGGETWYMPTFNRNKDSLAADVNGTYEGKSDAKTPYDDCVTYKEGDTVTGTAIYDMDTNDEDEGENAQEGVNIRTETETHTAKKTLNGGVIRMSEWLENPVAGDFWVWDDDGWFYWANPITSQTATGLLLDGIVRDKKMEEDWFYGMNVVAQFVTAGDSGEGLGTGFFDTDEGREPTENAMELLKTVGAIPRADEVSVASSNNATRYTPGGTMQFTAAASKRGWPVDNATFTWSVSGNTSNGTTIDKNGLLTVAADETGSTLTVTAVFAGDDFGAAGTCTVSG